MRKPNPTPDFPSIQYPKAYNQLDAIKAEVREHDRIYNRTVQGRDLEAMRKDASINPTGYSAGFLTALNILLDS